MKVPVDNEMHLMPHVQERLEYPFAEMETGESFTVMGGRKEAQRVRRAAWAYTQKHGRQFRVVRIDENTIRCWRMDYVDEAVAAAGGDD